MSMPIDFFAPDNVWISIHVVFLIAVGISYLSDTLKRYMYDDFYKFFKENREVLLGCYYSYCAIDYMRRWRENQQK